MTPEEIKTRIAELEDRRFFLNMSDHWSSDDYRLDREWWSEILELRKQLADIEAGGQS